MVVVQILYTFYVVALLRYTKVRYYVFIVLGNIATIAILLVVYIGSLSTIGSDAWCRESAGYISLELGLVGLFFFASVSEIIIKKEILAKQLKSMYDRFIRCEKLEEKVAGNKYDENGNRERVTEFHANLLYKKEVREEVELSNRTDG
jgi:uncharacterized membrane protein